MSGNTSNISTKRMMAREPRGGISACFRLSLRSCTARRYGQAFHKCPLALHLIVLFDHCLLETINRYH